MKYPRTLAALSTFPIIILIGLFIWSFFIPASMGDGGPYSDPTQKPDAVLGLWIFIQVFFSALLLIGVGSAGVGLWAAFYYPYNAVLKRLNGGVKPRPKFRSKKRIIETLRDDLRLARALRVEESHRRIRAEAEAERWEQNYWTLRGGPDAD